MRMRPVQRAGPPVYFCSFPILYFIENMWSDLMLYVAILTLTFFSKIKHFFIVKDVNCV